MPGSIELKGGIQLNGFSSIEPAKLIVIKKMVGSYARQFSDENEDYQLLKIDVTEGEGFTVDSTLVLGSGETSGKAQDPNLFVAIDKSLKSIKA